MNSIELFAGVGGLGIGVTRAGFEQVLAIEKDNSCCKTILFNQLSGLKDIADWNIINQDVKGFDFKQYEDKITLISGGPPCQPFSLGGKHLGDTDARDTFPSVVKIVRDVRPKTFIFENVRGLTRKQFINYFEYIHLQLTYPDVIKKKNEKWYEHLVRLEKIHSRGRYSGLSYNVIYKVLNAADYGLAQRRERVFLIGFRSDLNIEWSFPLPTHSQYSLLMSQSSGWYWERHGIPVKHKNFEKSKKAIRDKLDYNPMLLPWLTVRDIIFDLPDPEVVPVNSDFANHTFQPGARIYNGHTGSKLDEPAKTLKAGSHGVPGGENAIVKDDGSIRYLTVRESARLQGFPDTFMFNCSWGQAMKQLGNAVPISLAEILAKSVMNALV